MRDIIIIERVENIRDMTSDFRITLFGLIKIKRVLYLEQVIHEKLPFWLRASSWLLRVTCKHSWDKGKVHMNGIFLADFNTYYRKHKCKICAKERIVNLGSYEMYPHF